MKKFGIAFLLVGAMFAGNAQAAVTLSENADTRVITAKGSVDGTASTNLIALNIKDANGNVVYTSFIPTADGTIDYSFKLPDVSGIYTIAFTSHDGKPDVIKYEYLSVNDIDAILNGVDGAHGVNGAQCDTDVIDITDVRYEVLSMPGKWYTNLSEEDKKVIAAAILAGRGEGYISLQPIKEICRQALSMIAVDKAKDSEEVKEAFLDFSDLYDLGNNTKLYEKYQALSAAGKISAENIIAGADISTLDVLYKIFDEAAFLAMISSAKQPSDITEIIDKYAAVVSFSSSDYDKSDKDLMATALYAQKDKIKSFDDLYKLIEEAYKEQIKKPGNNDSNAGGSSGGGSGRVTIINNTPQAEPQTKPQAEFEGFADMENAEWAKPAVSYLAENGIVSGVGKNEFAPLKTVTREEFAVMTVNAFGLAVDEAVSEFSDMPKDHWAYKAISSAWKKGIVNGIGDGKFGTGENIKRQDIAVMLASAAAAAGYNLNGDLKVSFSDFSEVSDYAKESVSLLASSGIVNGYDDGTFKPNDNATRAEAAQILYAILTMESK